jgi:hypothetical protein
MIWRGRSRAQATLAACPDIRVEAKLTEMAETN